MSRRKQGTTRVAGLCLPPSAFESALHRITRLATQTVQVMAPLEMSCNELVDALFDPEELRVLRRARPLTCESISGYHTYDLDHAGVNVVLRVNGWDKISCLPPKHLNVQPDADRLYAHMMVAGEIIKKFSVVDKVLRVLQERTTPSTVRSIWPCIMSLVGSQYHDLFDVTSREAYGLGYLAPLLRDSMGTLASAALLPATQPDDPNNNYTLTYKMDQFEYAGVPVEPIGFNISFN